jgi:phosphoserine phosphatase RsbU/P
MLVEDVGAERFVTLLLAKLHPATRMLVYANAGHPAGFVLSPQGQVRAELKRTGIPLGLNPDLEYQSAAPLLLAAGEIVVLLTDGVDEAMSPQDEFFGSERALQIIRQHRDESAARIVDRLYQAVRDFAQGQPQHDDFTLIVIRVL